MKIQFAAFDLRWQTRDIVRTAYFVALWPVLGVFSFAFRVFLGDVYLPVFYFLIWFFALISNPIHAFVCAFLGHFLFDLTLIFQPYFLFVWLASGFSAFLISICQKRPRCLFFMLFFLPFSYLLSFLIISLIYFNNQFLSYFFIYPRITIMLLIVNPIFNFCVFLCFRKNAALKKLIWLGRQRLCYE